MTILKKNCLQCGKTFNNFIPRIGKYHTGAIAFSKKMYCSIDCRAKSRIGISYSEKSKAKIKKSLITYWKKHTSKMKGKKLDPDYVKRRRESRVYPTEESCPSWKGEKIGYSALHNWVEKKLGRPKICEHCGKDNFPKRYIHWANKSGLYLRELDDWLRLCAKCHRQYDKGQKGAIKKIYGPNRSMRIFQMPNARPRHPRDQL